MALVAAPAVALTPAQNYMEYDSSTRMSFYHFCNLVHFHGVIIDSRLSILVVSFASKRRMKQRTILQKGEISIFPNRLRKFLKMSGVITLVGESYD